MWFIDQSKVDLVQMEICHLILDDINIKWCPPSWFLNYISYTTASRRTFLFLWKYLIATIGHFACLSSDIPYHQVKLWLVPLFGLSHHTFTLISSNLLILDFYHCNLKYFIILRISSQRHQCGWRLLLLNTGWCGVYQSNRRLLHCKHL